MGDRGDNNRLFQSDPVLFKFAGELRDLSVLDAGCGTGYLSILLAQQGANVTGIDISENMITEARAFAKEKNVEIQFMVDSCSVLKSVTDQSYDLIVSNYVLMDLPDLDLATKNFHRVLKPGGKAVCIFGHPFSSELSEVENYFDEVKKTDRWGPFESDFIFFHRPLSHYWKSFRKAGFTIEDFEEPVAKDTSVAGFKPEWIASYRRKPWSVAFLLSKK